MAERARDDAARQMNQRAENVTERQSKYLHERVREHIVNDPTTIGVNETDVLQAAVFVLTRDVLNKTQERIERHFQQGSK